jgi:hypothetical protein
MIYYIMLFKCIYLIFYNFTFFNKMNNQNSYKNQNDKYLDMDGV